MQIVLFGAPGTIGQRIAREALSRGHRVRAVSRHSTRSGPRRERIHAAQGDVTDPASVARLARGADAIVSAVSPGGGQSLTMLSDAARALVAGARAAGTRRLIVVGGAGSLRAPEGGRVMDRAAFPPAWRPIAEAHAAALEVYRTDATGLDWTYLSPADVTEPGERTGHYRAGDENLVVGPDGSSRISTEDFAVALLDELERPAHVGHRFTVGY